MMMEEPHSESAIYSTPTCVQLGIPMSDCPTAGGMYPLREHGNNTDVTLPIPNYLDPRYTGSFMGHYSSYVPMPSPFGFYDLEPSFIRRRNERERERVRNVNEGYARLREHLPTENPEKRLSKVETLRTAIRYIKQLQGVLHTEEQKENNCDSETDRGSFEDSEEGEK
ncbi:achaete-scute homolog 5-like [Asterias rubens]|uniref:achaete-scute homolog 5-like n=1 Tax=Asterias rubens TaxID=7604 RepID=UPI001455025A|nr:achaete-scute homolog 5-like [Asterias rubens]